nr:putative membrane protein [Emiliania huxleyi virus 86]
INISWSSKILISMLLFGMIVQLSSDVQQPVQQPVPRPVQRPVQRPVPRPALPNTGQSPASSAAFALTLVPAAPPVSDIDAQIRQLDNEAKEAKASNGTMHGMSMRSNATAVTLGVAWALTATMAANMSMSNNYI